MLALMILVLLCTLSQGRIGNHAAVDVYIKSLFICWHSPFGKIPIFPGGGLAGLMLLINLIASQVGRLEISRRKAGLWILHLGLILLFSGEFVAGMFQTESLMAIGQGTTVNYSESVHDLELVVEKYADGRFGEAATVSDQTLSHARAATDPRLPFSVQIGNCLTRETVNDEGETHRELSAWIGLSDGASTAGPWLISSAQEMPLTASFHDRTYRLSIRPKRYYFPFSLTLTKFTHAVYPGTDIPRNFSSRLKLSNPSTREERDILISMNHPLRYAGRAFYQASFGKNDSMSVLQVVENPGWMIPYVSCILIAFGLLFHFAVRLGTSLKT